VHAILLDFQYSLQYQLELIFPSLRVGANPSANLGSGFRRFIPGLFPGTIRITFYVFSILCVAQCSP